MTAEKGADMQGTQVKARFTISGLDPEGYEGYHDPFQRWNGWATPRLTEAGARKLAADLDKARERDGDGWDHILIHNDPVAFDVVDSAGDIEGDVDDEFHDLVEADEDGLYGIGNFAWVWEVVGE